MHHIHEKVVFAGPEGRLSGNLQLPNRTPRAVVVLAHCFTCSKSLKITRQLATGIEAGGYAVLRFDFTGLGESEGDFAETTVSGNVADIGAAVRYVESRDLGPTVLAGHSLGGAATLIAAGDLPQVRAVAVIGAPASPEHVRHLFTEDTVERAFHDGRAAVRIAGRTFTISREFFTDLERHCTPERIAAINRPLVVVHGTADRVVAIGEGERIFGAAAQPKWFFPIPDGDHLFTRAEHAEQAAGGIRLVLDQVVGARGT